MTIVDLNSVVNSHQHEQTRLSQSVSHSDRQIMVDVKAFAQRLGLDWDVELTDARQPVLISEDDEQLSCSYANVELAVGDSGSSAGTGTAFVTTRFVCRNG